MNAARTMFAMLVLAAVGCAETPKERLDRAIADLGEQEGYVLNADWKIEVERLDKPATGKVESVVREKGDFLRLHATFEDGEVMLYQKGSRIAGQNLETKEWGSIDSDKKAKFVARMFNLKTFLAETSAMCPSPVYRQDQDDCTVIEAVAETTALKKMLGDSEAGEALVNNELHDPKMTVRVLVNRKGLVHRIEVDIEGDAKGEEIKPPAGGGNDPGGNWEEAPDEPPKPGEPKPEPKKEDEAPKAPMIQHVKIWIKASPNYKQDRNIEIPEAVKKVLGLN